MINIWRTNVLQKITAMKRILQYEFIRSLHNNIEKRVVTIFTLGDRRDAQD